MKKIIISLFFLFWCMSTIAGNKPDDQEEIKILIKKLYSISVFVFENGEYNGKYRPEKSCDLYRIFFIASLITKRNDGVPECLINFHRFPDEDEGTLGLSGPTPPAKPEFMMVTVDGLRATVKISLKAGKRFDSEIIFFMIRTSDGWRIENALSFKSRPFIQNQDESVACLGMNYIVPGTREQRKFEPRYCQKF